MPVEPSGTSISIRNRGTEDRARGQQEQHAREAEEVGDRLGDEAGRQHHTDREDDIARVHGRVILTLSAADDATRDAAARIRRRLAQHPGHMLFLFLLRDAPGSVPIMGPRSSWPCI